MVRKGKADSRSILGTIQLNPFTSHFMPLLFSTAKSAFTGCYPEYLYTLGRHSVCDLVLVFGCVKSFCCMTSGKELTGTFNASLVIQLFSSVIAHKGALSESWVKCPTLSNKSSFQSFQPCISGVH